MNLPITVGKSPALKIRAILAARDIKKGEVIERCPIILIEIKKEEHLEATTLKTYYFEWNQQYDCVVLGYGSVFNHSYNANATFYPDYKNKYMIFKAVKNIKKGEEICTNYNGDPKSKRKLEPGYLKPDKTYNKR